MSEEVAALGWAVELENVGAGVPEPVACPLARFSQQRLELGKGLFDGIEVGAVGRQVEHLSLAVFDRFPDAGDLVAGPIVQDDDIARAQGWGEDLLDVAAEDVAVQGAIQHVGCRDAGGPQAGHEGGGFPVTVGHRGEPAQTAGTPAKPARHVGGRRGLVEKHQALWGECRLAADEGAARGGHIRTLLLGGVQTFF
jgi:hypothetical protein